MAASTTEGFSSNTTAPTSNEAKTADPSQLNPSASSTTSSHVALPAGGVGSLLCNRFVIVLLIITIVLAGVGSIFSVPLAAIIICFGGIAYFKLLPLNNIYKSFAAANGFSYQADEEVPEQTGILFFIGVSGDFEDVVSGTYGQWPFFIFTYEYVVLENQNPVEYVRTVLAINFLTPLPAFFLRKRHRLSNAQQDSEAIQIFGYAQSVKLEGDFDEHLQLFIRPNTQDDVLAVITPDLMSLLINLDVYEIEMSSAGDFYIYAPKNITSRQELMNVFLILERLASKIGRDVNRTDVLINTERES